MCYYISFQGNSELLPLVMFNIFSIPLCSIGVAEIVDGRSIVCQVFSTGVTLALC